MTQERAYEIERLVIYQHIDHIMCALEDCENSNVVFNVGRRLGMMQYDLKKALEEEIEKGKKINKEF